MRNYMIGCLHDWMKITGYQVADAAQKIGNKVLKKIGNYGINSQHHIIIV